MKLNDMAFESTSPAMLPQKNVLDCQAMLADAALIVDHTFHTGLIATWSMLPATLAECIYEESPHIAAALGNAQLIVKTDDQVCQWLLETGKFGWLIRVEQMVRPEHITIKFREAGRWFFHERLDCAITDAVAWAKGE
jgi:hypothetical protein